MAVPGFVDQLVGDVSSLVALASQSNDASTDELARLLSVIGTLHDTASTILRLGVLPERG
jgi:hypothetical protein